MSKSRRYSHSELRSEAMLLEVYGPPSEETKDGDISDVACRILDDDGPRPMARMRPAKKTPNAAEQFNTDHQQQYEAYGARSRDRVQAVRMHNAAYPYMRDEIKRKRSTGRITMNSARRDGIATRTSYNRSSKKPLSRKRRGGTEPRRLVGPRRNSITKPKHRARAFGPQRNLRSERVILHENNMVEKSTLTCRDFFYSAKSTSSQYSETASSKKKGPDTDASVSSYNTYASLEHEPMVSN